MAGTFDHVGEIAANGVARWDGASWHALGDGVGPVRWLLADGTKLVAGTPGGEHYEWTGESWSFLRKSLPEQRGVLLDGELLFASDLPRWIPSDSRYRCTRGGSLTEHEGELYLVRDCTIQNPMPTSFSSLAKFRNDEWGVSFTIHENPVGLSGVGIPYVGSHSGELLIQWIRSVPGETITGIERIDGVPSEPLSHGIELQGFSTLDGATYFVEPRTVLIHSEVGDRVLGTIDGGSPHSSIYDIESFDDRIFIAGDFRGIDDLLSPNLAYWR